ncbi:putative ABC-type branched-chain amino acid transport systems, ATP binding component [Cupriavidus taiwanensis]|uniref:ABC-type branched-chain amino acid transport systems, ATP binding component n=1 Tax=Cupriavidus taiwanensis TaxID=164546 RepID=A0A976AU09_9BURK|nr:ABC transporter ATP-binding protein [Cupriavidus taiwanensis]SOZ50432.1 putative ABC-type branched-chain amino acid transport systems, ATP binding component [Cupriavidus taiwanensis]SOZ51310.1 putative ABC-type branched-chain amino acid transport systems, ATP binding component [Cupriavidus taiwanensis]SOZ53985.1 putative ABC-type branched-chain amino acid transport systems, ATP binding component [Cupriavidus taiwanensis]SPA04238.1 putative ABC-type branched-chain amino acid transport systems
MNQQNPAAAAAAPMIEATGINAWYGSSHVLRDIDFTVGAGETVGLLGRNGMGKSTLLRTLLGHVRQRQGRIVVAGREVSRAQPFEVARLGVAYVPEGRGIFPSLSVRENLLMAARKGCHGRSDWDEARVLDLFPRLKERLSHGGQQLSGGEQQMLSIGRALMTNPECLVLDEATEGLAPRIVREIWAVIATVRSTGIASVVVDRNFRSVLAHADRAVVLEKGRVVLSGPASDLAGKPEALDRYLGV